jgi:hypothetical protein
MKYDAHLEGLYDQLKFLNKTINNKYRVYKLFSIPVFIRPYTRMEKILTKMAIDTTCELIKEIEVKAAALA